MKKILILSIIMVTLFLLTACGNKNDFPNQEGNNQNTKAPNQYYPIGINNSEEKQYYFTYNNKNYYFIGIDGIEVSFKNIKLVKNLKQALDEELTTIDNMISKANSQEKINNGVLYHYDTFNYIQCDNNDNYFINASINKNICN